MTAVLPRLCSLRPVLKEDKPKRVRIWHLSCIYFIHYFVFVGSGLYFTSTLFVDNLDIFLTIRFVWLFFNFFNKPSLFLANLSHFECIDNEKNILPWFNLEWEFFLTILLKVSSFVLSFFFILVISFSYLTLNILLIIFALEHLNFFLFSWCCVVVSLWWYSVVRRMDCAAVCLQVTPSVYTHEMLLSTEERLANTKEVHSPRILELLDMSETTHHKVNAGKCFFFFSLLFLLHPSSLDNCTAEKKINTT